MKKERGERIAVSPRSFYIPITTFFSYPEQLASTRDDQYQIQISHITGPYSRVEFFHFRPTKWQQRCGTAPPTGM